MNNDLAQGEGDSLKFLRSCFTLPLVHPSCSLICGLPQSGMIP